MSVQDFIPRIQAAGFILEADGSDIVVRPFSRLTEPQRAFIRQHKAGLLAILTGSKPSTQPPIPGRLSAPIPPTMRQWDYQRGGWHGETQP